MLLSQHFLHTYSFCSFPGRVHTGANLLPMIQPTQQDQMLVRQSRRLRWRQLLPPAHAHRGAATQSLCRVASETSLVVSHRCWQRNKEQLCTSSPGTLVSLLYTMFLIAQRSSLQDCPVSVCMAALQGGTVPSLMKREPLWSWKKDNKSNHSCIPTVICTLVLPFTAPLL